MKKKLAVCLLFLFTLFFSADEKVLADSKANTETSAETVAAGPVESTASIGFSIKIPNETSEIIPGGDDGQTLKPVGRLLSTGEIVNGGLSAIGLLFLLFVLIYWLRKQKEKIKESY